MRFENITIHDQPGVRTTHRTLFFDDNYQLIEAPTLWIDGVAQRRSESEKTEQKYSWIIARYLQWLDDSGYGSTNWALVDEDILNQYIIFLQVPDSANGSAPLKKTVVDYICRIVDFYRWARAKGYKHYLYLEMNEVKRKVRDQLLLAHINDTVTACVPRLKVKPSAAKRIRPEKDKFLTQNEFRAALDLLDDPVFVVIATVVRVTGMRPKELLQLPYRGRADNCDFVPYDFDSIPPSLASKTINFFCESKGKNRVIRFPGKLWSAICRLYIPLRRERAELFFRRTGKYPPNSALFLTKNGTIVTYENLHYHFGKVGDAAHRARESGVVSPYSRSTFGARMLRHTCATYFVADALRARNQLHRPYIYDAALDEELRELLGHEDVGTTYKHYVHCVKRLLADDLLSELHRTRVDSGLAVMLDRFGYGDPPGQR